MRLDVWNPEYIAGVTAVHEVYVTDLSVAHHICSFERNAWCLGIRTEFTFADGLSEERIEELQEIEASNPPQDDYFLMARIEKLPFVKWDDDPEDEDDEAMEAAREYFQGNWREPTVERKTEAKAARAAYLDATEAVIDLNLTILESTTNQETP